MRILAALLHMVVAARRIETHCVKIAGLVMRAAGTEPRPSDLSEMLDRLGSLVISEASLAREAFALRDVRAAYETVRADSELRGVTRAVLRRAVDIGDGQGLHEPATSMFLVANWLERIGDDAVEIAEQTVILLEGLFREVSDVEAPLRAAAAI